MCPNRIARKFNCGFARVAVRELTPASVKERDYTKRKQEFERLFNGQTYNLPQAFFKKRKCRESLFDDWSAKIISAFSKRWESQDLRKEYMTTLSIATWKAMTPEEREEHTLSECKQCYTLYPHLQLTFPLKPVFIPPLQQSLQDEIKRSLLPSKTPAQKLGQIIQGGLEPLCKSVTGKSFCNVMDATTTINLEKKPTPAEKKKRQRETLRGVERKLEHRFEQRDFDLVMQNRLSFNKYNQIRLATSFETTDDARQRVFRKGVKLRRHGKREEN